MCPHLDLWPGGQAGMTTLLAEAFSDHSSFSGGGGEGCTYRVMCRYLLILESFG